MRSLAGSILTGLLTLTIGFSAQVASAEVGMGGSRVWVKDNGRHRAEQGQPPAQRKVPAKTAKKIATNKKRVADYQLRLAAQQVCVVEYRTSSINADASRCIPVSALDVDDLAGTDPDVLRAAFDPEDIAYIAFAQLTLDAPKPHVGPPPSINRWKMAAVGYPLWLWADGRDPAPVSDRVFGLYVSLDAQVQQISYSMGDGNTVTCSGRGTAWHRGVKAGAPSPSCGYTYQRPSRPRGDYTITARTQWAVDWNVSGTTGTIPFVQVSTTTLPVGELQVLVR